MSGEHPREAFHPLGEGLLVNMDGSCYSGQMIARKDGSFPEPARHGLGLQLFSDGSFYAGEYSQDKAEGQGFFCSSEGSMYYGAFKDDIRHGFGQEYCTTGVCYVGEFKQG